MVSSLARQNSQTLQFCVAIQKYINRSPVTLLMEAARIFNAFMKS